MSEPYSVPQGGDLSRSFGPVGGPERLALLDVLRGVAVFAILLVNYDYGQTYFDVFAASGLDRLAHWLVYVLGRDKFWPFFALLFGVGFAIQLERAESRGVNILPTYLRRLFFLALIGCALLLVIDVAILLFLAIAGLPLLLIGYALRRRSPYWVLAAALVVFTVYQGIAIADNLARNRGLSGPPAVSAEEVANRTEEYHAEVDAGAERSASWNWEALRQRVQSMLSFYVHLPGIMVRNRGKVICANLQFMLVGVFLWQVGILKMAAARRRLLLRLLLVSLPVGFGAAVFVNQVDHAWALTQLGLGAYPSQLSRVIFAPLHTIAAFGMDLAYLAGIALLMQRSAWAKHLSGVFAPVGRMALSNYALQALIPALLFGHYTPGIQRQSLGNVLCIAVLIAVFGLQVLFSRAWMKSYRFGPLEWLWRSLTYWRLQPMSSRRQC